MHKPIISVILLTYNQETTIARAIDSVLNQECEYEFEILLADDCSNDDTGTICQDYAHKFPNHIKYIRNAENKGLVDNYFDTLLVAQGKYIADCAGDDYWTDPKKLQKQVEILEANPDVTLVHAGWNYVDYKTQKVSQPQSPNGYFKYRLPFVKGNELLVPFITGEESPVPIVHLSTAVFRKEPILNEYQKFKDIFRSKTYNCEDIPVIAAAMANGTIAYIPDVVMNYTTGHSSISSSDNFIKAFDFSFGALLLRLKLIDIYQLEDSLHSKYLRKQIDYVLGIGFRTGSKERLQKILSVTENNKVKLNFKQKLYKTIANHTGLWKVLLPVLNVIKSK